MGPCRLRIATTMILSRECYTMAMEKMLEPYKRGRWHEFENSAMINHSREVVRSRLGGLDAGEMAQVTQWRDDYMHKEYDLHLHLEDVWKMNMWFADHCRYTMNENYGITPEGASILIDSGMMLNNAKAYFLIRREIKWLYAFEIVRRDAFVAIAEFWVHWRPVIEKMYEAEPENKVLWRIKFEVELDGSEVADFRKLESDIKQKKLWDWRVSGPCPGSAAKLRRRG